MDIAPELFWTVKSQRLIRQFHNDTPNIYLVATGKKPASEMEYGTYPATKEAVNILKEAGLSTLILYSEKGKKKKERFQIIFWKGPQEMQHMALQLLNYDDGALYGFPQCCRDKYATRTRPTPQYHRELHELYTTQGLEGVLPLAGISHLPCTIDCGATRALGYSDALKRAPEIYGVAINDLLQRVQNAMMEGPR